MLNRFVVLFILVLVNTVCTAETTNVTVVSRGDDNAKYAIAMLNLALEEVGDPFAINVISDALSAPKLREELIAGSIDVIWTATNRDMETNALPVRVPLFKGLLGHRILIVHKDNVHLFDHVTSMQQALAFTYGQGQGWTDTTIMQANGMKVVAANKYESLFYMTDGKRFDAFPRGVHEPWGEIAQRSELELTVEPNLMFVYQMPYYLMVTPKRPDLAANIERGLTMAIEDGSFDQMFYGNAMVKTVLQYANLRERRIFNLTNPELPSETPLDNKKLWVDIATF